MQTVTRSKPQTQDSSPQTCNCSVHKAMGQARDTLREIGFDPHDSRGVFYAELAVVLARLDNGLPPLRGSLESLAYLAQRTAA